MTLSKPKIQVRISLADNNSLNMKEDGKVFEWDVGF